MQKSSSMLRKIGLLSSFVATIVFAILLLNKLNFTGESHANVNDLVKASREKIANITGPVSYANTVEKAAPAVVSIKTSRKIAQEENPLMRDPFFRRFFGDLGIEGQNGTTPEEQEQQGLGSGVIFNEQGHILTNYHVVREVDEISVALADGRSAKAQVIGSDPDSDLAVLKVDLKNLPVITIGSSSNARPGDVVLAIGNPFGLDQSVSLGIISATKRNQTGLGLLENLLQTDAAINPGNSGGALINVYGELIGINTAIFSHSGGHQGIGFAIPIDLAKENMTQLMSGKTIAKGFLGLQLQNINDEIRETFSYPKGDGVFVRAIVHNSPAQKAGIMPGDILLKIDSTVLKDDISTHRLVRKLTPNKSYTLEVFRQTETLSITVKVGERKAPENKKK